MSSSSPAPKRILIADDDSSLRSLLNLVIEEEGYAVIEAQNGEDCLIQFTRNSPDLVLLDAVMPDMDGFSCCEKIRSLKTGQELPILMITFLDDEESIEKAFAVGATDYLTKPIHWAVLLQRLKRLIASSEAIQQLKRLQQWQDILDILLKSLSDSCLNSNKLTELFNKIIVHFSSDKIVYILPNKEAIIAEQETIKYIQALDIKLSDSFVVINGLENPNNSSTQFSSLLSILQAKSCLISVLTPLKSHFIIANNKTRNWQDIEIEKFKQITSLLSHLILT